MTLDEKIQKLIKARQNRRATWVKVLGELHGKLGDAFEEIRILGPCGHCTACHNKPFSEKGIILGKIAFTDGGNCYFPAVCIDTGFGWKQIAYCKDQWKITEEATKNDFEIAKGALSEIQKKIEQLIEQEKDLTAI